jgi:hypothetical protein
MGLLFLRRHVEERNGPRLDRTMDFCIVALGNYFEQIGTLPQGSNRQILAALMGENHRDVSFYEPKQKDVSSRGELLDPWGTPYQFFAGETVLILSAGENRVFEPGPNSDDYYRTFDPAPNSRP